jgi:hypothetical protein
MKHTVRTGSDAMTPDCIKIGSGIQKLLCGDTQTHRQYDDLVSLLTFFPK